jgi:hypothetical protein
MMSGSGTALFAMGDPPSLRKDFSRTFAEENKVRVWSARFTSRKDASSWYPNPFAPVPPSPTKA